MSYFMQLTFFDNSILGDEPFAKALRILEPCVLVNNRLYGKLFWSFELPATFDESFKVTSVPFFILGFNSWSWELTTLCLKCYSKSFYFIIILKQNKTAALSQFLVKNLKRVLLLFQWWHAFPYVLLDLNLLIQINGFGSASSACCLLKFIAVVL